MNTTATLTSNDVRSRLVSVIMGETETVDEGSSTEKTFDVVIWSDS